jgi:catechol 2,3-dioxygenase-like lactoylglutathione lyase family enzyme
MRIAALDHLVLTVRDVEQTIAFYQRVLGMTPVTFGSGRRALAFGSQKINLHQLGKEFEPKAGRATAGSADFCLLSASPLAEVVAELQSLGVNLVAGPVQRTGAVGTLDSVYIRDPDDNLIEIAVYRSESADH